MQHSSPVTNASQAVMEPFLWAEQSACPWPPWALWWLLPLLCSLFSSPFSWGSNFGLILPAGKPHQNLDLLKSGSGVRLMKGRAGRQAGTGSWAKNAAEFGCDEEQIKHLRDICMHPYKKDYPPLHPRKPLRSKLDELKACSLFGCRAPQGWGRTTSIPITSEGTELCPVSTFRYAISLPNCLVDR